MANKINIAVVVDNNASKPLKDIGNDVDAVSGKTNKYGGVLGALGGPAGAAVLAVGAVGGAMALAGKTAVTSAADYEQSLNVFKSVSGATAEQMVQVGQKARELGNDITLPGISSKDAALSMVELAKAGLSVNDTMAASKGVLSLAKAGQMDTAAAAEVAANALNAFNLSGDQATRVADLLAAAANASSADVSDLAFSLQMSSAGAAAVKVPLEDLTAMIAEMANNGVKGSDAGTSLKTMFMNLIPTTDRARESMKALNLDFYDAKGNFIGVREMIDQLQKGTAKLTDEQRAQHIENIFGSDSSRAANILIKEGIKGYDEMAKSVNRAGAATELAAAQNSGFKGALDSVQSALETVAIDIGTKMLPTLTDLARGVANKVDPAFTALKNTGKEVFSFLRPAIEAAGGAFKNDLVPAMKEVAKSDIVKYLGGALLAAVYAVITVLTVATKVLSTFANQASQATSILVLLGAGFVTYQAIVAASTVKTVALTVAQTALNTAMKLNPYALVAAAAIGIGAAYAQVIMTSDRQTISTKALKEAQDQLVLTTNAAKDAQDRLAGANLNAEGANLAVERAQRSYNDALAQYGPTSLEAREASYNLKQAQQQLADANAAVRDRTNEANRAEQDKKNAAADVVKKLKETKDAAFEAAGGYAQLAQKINDAVEADKKTGVNNGFGGKNQTNAVFGLKHAIGTSYAPGGRTLVGEHGPEEVEMPRGARVTQAYRTRNETSSGSTVNLNIENFNINNGGDKHRMLSDIGFALRLAS